MVNRIHNHGRYRECDCPNPGGDKPSYEKPQDDNEYIHVTKNGLIVSCYHHCKNSLASVSFWIGMTAGYPAEHLLWTKVPILRAFCQWIGIE